MYLKAISETSIEEVLFDHQVGSDLLQISDIPERRQVWTISKSSGVQYQEASTSGKPPQKKRGRTLRLAYLFL